MGGRHWQDVANVGVGLWIFVSTSTLLQHAMADAPLWHLIGASPPEDADLAALWALVVAGVVVAFFAALAWLTFGRWQEWINLALGVWLVVSPWAIGFQAAAALRWNAILSGAIVAALAAWVLMSDRWTRFITR